MRPRSKAMKGRVGDCLTSADRSGNEYRILRVTRADFHIELSPGNPLVVPRTSPFWRVVRSRSSKQ